MKRTINCMLKKTLLASTALVFAGFVATETHAGSTPVEVSVTVQNTLNLLVTDMNFGTIVIAGAEAAVPPEDSEIASVVIATDNALTASATGAPAYAAIYSDTNASAGIIEISDGAPSATINVTISNVADPTFGTDTLYLSDFMSSTDGGATETARTVDTSFPITFEADGTATLAIGATLSTGDRAGMYDSGLYEGSFDVTFNY